MSHGLSCQAPRVDTPSAEERAAWARRLGDETLHRRLADELPCLHHADVRQPPAPMRLHGWVRVGAWNAQRGGRAAAAAELFAPDVGIALLSELDVGMARTDNAHTAHDLATALGPHYGYAYGVEFVELGLGNVEERQRCGPDANNERGLQGNAIVSGATLSDVTLIRLDDGGDWFEATSPEPRVGGRMALVATVDMDRTPVRLASTHLENVTDPAGRAAQFEALLDALGSGPALIGGDLNTFGTSFDEILDRNLTRRLLSADPSRFVWPVAYEPLFAAAAARGFTWEAANTATPTTTHGPLKIDWLLTRGLDAAAPEVIEAGHLSDHHVVVVDVRVAE